MHNLLHQLIFWYWFGLAAILLILELLTGSGFLLGIGVSAAIVGCVLYIFPILSPVAQLLGFAILAVLSTVSWRSYLKKNPARTDRPTLNRRGAQYVGRVFTLDKPVVNGIGVVHIDDTMWRLHCADLPAGSRIVITGVDGVILLAKPKD
ncbi:MAG: NfeD family protein [Gammaproteobacteria bacterium]